jgi:ADP-ribose pyrophosphatase
LSPVEPQGVRRIFDGKLITVDVETWPAGEREVVRHPGACAIVAFTPEGEVVLVRQFREAIRQELLEIPAGIFDVEGEDAATCATRELLEETGFRAVNVERLATIYTSPGFADERIELFRADAEPAGDGEEESVEVVTMRPDRAFEAIRRGDIVDAKTVTGLLLASGREA